MPVRAMTIALRKRPAIKSQVRVRKLRSATEIVNVWKGVIASMKVVNFLAAVQRMTRSAQRVSVLIPCVAMKFLINAMTRVPALAMINV